MRNMLVKAILCDIIYMVYVMLRTMLTSDFAQCNDILVISCTDFVVCTA
jgi:hypothetical protein